METRRNDTEEWFERWFRSDLYLKLYAHRDVNEAASCVDLILDTTGLSKRTGSTHALDLACGPGRHAAALALRGIQVTAVDLSSTLLEHGRRAAEEANVASSIRFVRSDMRTIDFREEFDLVVQLFTSFGYFDSVADDMLVLERVREALRPGGFYALDLINEQHLRKSLVEESIRSVGGVRLLEQREILGDRIEKKITIPDGDSVIEFVESVRLFPPEKIDEMLREAGMTPTFWYGDYHGHPFDPEWSERMLVVSRVD